MILHSILDTYRYRREIADTLPVATPLSRSATLTSPRRFAPALGRFYVSHPPRVAATRRGEEEGQGEGEGGRSAFREHRMPYIIAEPCINVKDRSCVDVCPVDCIYEGPEMLYIHPDECIDCGACEPECPVTAIFPEEDTPPQWKSFIALNRDVFQSENPPGKPQRKGS